MTPSTTSSRSGLAERALGLLGAGLLAACAPPAGGDSAREAVDVADVGPTAPLQFRVPMAAPELFSSVMGVDHDPVEYGGGMSAWQCADYLGRAFPHCYDQHDGSDFILEGGFDTMDAGSTEVVAAASGVVISTEDGNYDRCHASLTTGDVDCDGHEMVGNHVVIEHETGHVTRYWHLMNGSVAVAVGDVVAAGDVLGKVGSSGYSSLPHLHFEVQDAAEVIIDPFAGPRSQPESWWCQQNAADALPGVCPE